MFKPSTLSVAKPIVDALHHAQIVLNPKSDSYPVGVMYQHLSAPAAPDFLDLSSEDMVKLKDRFARLNEKQTDATCGEFDELVGLMAHGVERMLNTIRGALIPYCKAVTQDYDAMHGQSAIPEIKVKPFAYHPIHAEAGLVEHVTTAHASVRQMDSYRTFRLEFPGVDVVAEWVGKNHHVDAKTTADWFLGLGEDLIKSVWWELFDGDRTISPENLYQFSRGRLPENIDGVLLGYFLTSYLQDEPQDVQGESVSLNEWTEAFGYLHRYLGALLTHAYERRVKDARNGRIILRSIVSEGMVGHIEVIVNGDVWGDWLEAGGNVKQVLGAAVAAPMRRHAKDLDDVKDDLITTWDRKHYMFKQIKADQFAASRRSTLVSLLVHQWSGEEQRQNMPPLGTDEVRKRAEALVRSFSDAKLDDPTRAIKDLVCEVFYPNTPYREFLDTMDRIARECPDMSAREVSLITVAELVAQWLAKQVVTISVEHDVRGRRSGSGVPEVAAVETDGESPPVGDVTDPQESAPIEAIPADEHGEVPSAKPVA